MLIDLMIKNYPTTHQLIDDLIHFCKSDIKSMCLT
jgi:hypothetical protein